MELAPSHARPRLSVVIQLQALLSNASATTLMPEILSKTKLISNIGKVSPRPSALKRPLRPLSCKDKKKFGKQLKRLRD